MLTTKNILANIPGNIKILSIQGNSFPIDLSYIFSRFPNLEMLSISDAQLENIPDLSKTGLKHISLNNTNIKVMPKLPAGCIQK